MSYPTGPTNPNPANGPQGSPTAGVNPFGERPPNAGQPGPYPYPPPGYPPTATDPALRMVVPIGVSPWAIAAGYLGLLSFLCGVTGPFALITGILALRQIKRDPQLGGHVRAWVGIVLGVFGSVGLGFILISMLISLGR